MAAFHGSFGFAVPFSFLLAVAFSILSAAQATGPSSTCDEVDDAASLMHLRQTNGGSFGAKASEKAQVLSQPPGGDEAAILQVIDEAFEDVKGPGSFLQSNVHEDDSWQICGGINWPSNPSIAPGTTIYRDMEEFLGITQYCDPNTGSARDDATCKAIYAAQRAIFELAGQFPQGPKFVNASITAWGNHPSYIDGSVGPVAKDSMPPVAPILNGNAASGWILCDIVRTVLTQSADQAGSGVCGWVAPLGALSRRAPAQAIRMLVRLMWSGRASSQMSQPCPYIYDQQPGLVPYEDNQNRWHPSWFSGSDVHCSGNAADCQVAIGSPLQPAGATFAFTQSLLSSFRASVGGSCDLHPAQLNYPGAPKSLPESITTVQGQGNYGSLYACNTMIDPVNQACKLVVNTELRGSLSSADFMTLFAYPSEPLQMKQFSTVCKDTAARAEANGENIGQAVSEAIKQLAASSTWIATYFKTIMDIYGGDLQKALTLISLSDTWGTPSFTEDLLASACKADVAFFSIDAEPMQNQGFTPESAVGRAGPYYPRPDGKEVKKVGECDHAVFLESCDQESDLYTIWTWGSRRYFTKLGLLGTPATDAGDPNPAGPFNTGVLCSATLGSLSVP
ncbi:unnamed protein product [Polarella glacialis]|uniref:Phospholipase B-like n=1 Tax=Polarella glacialis TaxID=89957 RepID=A0A813G187_POLGL|nr:unnamed protein product [Polarella glacialis]CAE8646047.1 unnamed protein product [Polarella glacialis]